MFPLDAEWHSEGEELGPDAGSISKAERRKQFLDFMATVALHADVSVEKKAGVTSHSLCHLIIREP